MRIASGLLFCIFMYTVSPLSLLVISAPEAQAAGCGPGGCGSSESAAGSGLGSLLGGGGGMQSAMMLMLIMSMLMQLFQGGSTPQQGTAEEAAPQPANIGPTERGTARDAGKTDNGTGTSTAQSGLASQSIFLATTDGVQTVSPATLTVQKGNGFNFFNASDNKQNVRIYNTNTPNAALNQAVEAGSAQVFNFESSGTFKVCLVTNNVESCKSTITVP